VLSLFTVWTDYRCVTAVSVSAWALDFQIPRGFDYPRRVTKKSGVGAGFNPQGPRAKAPKARQR
jgi:hypothetical protein